MFHKKPDPKEAARGAKREVRRSERDLDNEIRKLDRDEAALIADIKKTAKKAGSDKATRILASQLVTLRSQREKLYMMKSNIKSVGYQSSAIAGQAAMAGVMSNVSGVMKKMNDSVGVEQTMKIMNEFAKNSELANMREEMINDALIDAFDNEGTEEETNLVVDSVLAEIGLEISSKMDNAPTHQPATVSTAENEQEDQTERLLKQLNAL